MLRTALPSNTLLHAMPLLLPSFVQCSVVASVAKLMLVSFYVNKPKSSMGLLRQTRRVEACDRNLSRSCTFSFHVK